MGVITISREFSSGGESVARLVADKLGFFLVDHREIAAGLESYGITGYPPLMDNRDDRKVSYQEQREEINRYLYALKSYLREMAGKQSLVIMGRGANLILSDIFPCLRVRIVAEWKYRVEKAVEDYELGRKAAEKLIEEQDEKKNRYFKQVFEQEWGDVKAYDLVVNSGSLEGEKAAEIIVAAYRLQEENQPAESVSRAGFQAEPAAIPTVYYKEVSFMHPSEEDIAGMLDFYRLRWEYEPKTFVLEWDNEGNVQEAFTPDFYLPDYDLYLEITTQKQQLGWKKNKKIRRLKELYPHINIKLINKQSFQSLLQKFGLDQ